MITMKWVLILFNSLLFFIIPFFSTLRVVDFIKIDWIVKLPTCKDNFTAAAAAAWELYEVCVYDAFVF